MASIREVGAEQYTRLKESEQRRHEIIDLLDDELCLEEVKQADI
jgi:hypothetical protein